jgi:hypothetical protein
VCAKQERSSGGDRGLLATLAVEQDAQTEREQHHDAERDTDTDPEVTPLKAYPARQGPVV